MQTFFVPIRRLESASRSRGSDFPSDNQPHPTSVSPRPFARCAALESLWVALEAARHTGVLPRERDMTLVVQRFGSAKKEGKFFLAFFANVCTLCSKSKA